MKAIAEYFRDLAADDRYFGAEPPTPDAEMLARIAEREIARRVEAHEEQGKIVLRAGAERALGQAVALTQAVAEQDAVEDPAQEPVPPKAAEPEPIAADPEPEVVADDTSEDIPEEVVEAAEVDVPEGLEEEQPEVAEQPEQGEVAPVAEEPVAAEPVQEATVQEVTKAPAIDSDSIAAKLSRIRSVVSGADQSFGADEYNEDEHAQDFIDTTTADLNAALAEDESAATSDADYSMVEIDDDELAAIMARANSGADLVDEIEEAPVEARQEQAEPRPHAQEPESKEAEASSEFEDTLASLLADAMPKSAAAPNDAQPEQTAAPEAEMTEEADVEQGENRLTSASARVIKIKRAEFEAAVASGLFQEDDTDDEMPDAEDSNLFEDDGSALSPEEEAELQRELAEVEAEFESAGADTAEEAEASDADADDWAEEESPTAQQDDVEDDAESEIAEIEEQAAPQADHGRRRLERAETPSDLTRIFDETDNQLDAPASSQRRNAIQHLRAAVAATRAETKAVTEPQRGADDSAYRDDLASVVRPRRPQVIPETGRSMRPEEARPAPLKLVAEQRIDTPRDPIRPRRVSTADIAPAAEKIEGDSGFSAFAEEMGANQLPELLEAAAAYLADVEGRPQFSRPMLMGKLKEVEQDRFSREDGLRSFGQLLRQGKLQKLAGGRFSVTEETEYRGPGARNVG
ncbi:MAG: hypothetical protein RQ750_01110 [Roseovarius sp.]|nr:hypothetical protein [Roseovarius sp.]